MNKPKIGDRIEYTLHGAAYYHQNNGSWPPGRAQGCNGLLGVVVSFAAGGRICTVKTDSGDTESFIWNFGSGLNTHFTWPGKHETDHAQTEDDL